MAATVKLNSESSFRSIFLSSASPHELHPFTTRRSQLAARRHTFKRPLSPRRSSAAATARRRLRRYQLLFRRVERRVSARIQLVVLMKADFLLGLCCFLIELFCWFSRYCGIMGSLLCHRKQTNKRLSSCRRRNSCTCDKSHKHCSSKVCPRGFVQRDAQSLSAVTGPVTSRVITLSPC